MNKNQPDRESQALALAAKRLTELESSQTLTLEETALWVSANLNPENSDDYFKFIPLAGVFINLAAIKIIVKICLFQLYSKPCKS